jgi:TusA-related sulfurtransferase
MTLLLAAAALALPALAQEPSMPKDCPMMQKSQATADDRLSTLIKEMNEAKGSAKVDRMAAVINELVAQRKEMQAAMPHPMMDCPMMHDTSSQAGKQMDHAAHGADAMMSRGAKGMGFDQIKTTHHFALLETGGRIEVTANDAADNESISAIRMHLTHIASAFAKGDFDLPMFIHNQTPPGVPEMKRLQTAIHYRYQEIPRGARVVITTSDPTALDAVHQFLRFQIEEHKTGDPVTGAGAGGVDVVHTFVARTAR